MQRVCVLGASGSIGLSTLDVIARHPDRFALESASAYSNVDAMLEICLAHDPSEVVMVCEQSAESLQNALRATQCRTKVFSGAEALEEIASAEGVDVVMAAIVGAAGLAPNLSAVRAGKRVLLANKESLVMSGELFMKEAASSGSLLLPIDSEHNAIFQCLPDRYRCGTPVESCVKRILLTASGGPFRGFDRSALARVTPAEACKHPNWSMGQKISVDSASLMNKGLELIEACWLFDVLPSKVDVHVHPESVIHSMVEYSDGSVLAQMGNPDMRTPIAYGMAWPDRIDAGVGPLDLFQIAQLNFERPDYNAFPCLRIAEEAFLSGGTSCAILNAANEVAVEAFLKGNIGFLDIPDIIERTLGAVPKQEAVTIDCVIDADRQARESATSFLSQVKRH